MLKITENDYIILDCNGQSKNIKWNKMHEYDVIIIKGAPNE